MKPAREVIQEMTPARRVENSERVLAHTTCRRTLAAYQKAKVEKEHA